MDQLLHQLRHHYYETGSEPPLYLMVLLAIHYSCIIIHCCGICRYHVIGPMVKYGFFTIKIEIRVIFGSWPH